MSNQSTTAATGGTPRVQRVVGGWALLFTGLSAIIGSGWLFGAMRAASLAGPGSIIAWVIGAVVVMLIALIGSELGTMMPETGGMVRFAQYTHGGLVGFIAGWANWIAIASVISVEGEASIQYMSSWPFEWTHNLYAHGELSTLGLLLSGVLVVGYFLLNYWGVKLFAHTNSAITVIKLIIPALTATALIVAGFHSGNVSGATPNGGDGSAGGFLPYGWAGVLTAVSTSGIMFSFNGFQSPLNLAGEARNPDRSIPFAVIGSVAIATVVYLLLQVAYLGAVDPARIAQQGWAHVDFSSPFAQLALAFNLNWLALALYFDAFLSPSGTGTTYMASVSRMVVGMARNGTAPEALGRIDPVWHAPRAALWFNLGIAFVFLYFFRGWGTLAAAISVATVFSYLMIPVAAMTLRRRAPERRRAVHAPALGVIAPVAFVAASELLFWAKWPLTGRIILILVIGLPIYVFYRRAAGRDAWARDLRAAWWLLVYIPFIALISKIGSPQFGGIGLIPYGWDMALVAVAALGFIAWGARSGGDPRHLAEMDKPIDPETLSGEL